MLLVFMIFIKELTVLSGRKTISVFNSCFWQIVEAKSKAMGCWLLPTPRMVSFSFSIIDCKSLTYVGGSRPITVFRLDKHSFCATYFAIGRQ